MSYDSEIVLSSETEESAHTQYFYACDFCNEHLPSRKELGLHIHTHQCSAKSCNRCLSIHGPKKTTELPSADTACQNGYASPGDVTDGAQRTERLHATSGIDDCHEQILHDGFFLVEEPVKYPAKHLYFCEDCDNTFVCPSTFEIYVQPPHTLVKKQLCKPPAKHLYFCVDCDHVFTYKSSLVRHMKSHDVPQKQRFRCDQCGLELGTRFNLSRHQKLHSPSHRFFCSHCTKSFLNKRNLQTHLNSHSEIIKFFCGVCEKSYKSKLGFNKHLKSFHPEIS